MAPGGDFSGALRYIVEERAVRDERAPREKQRGAVREHGERRVRVLAQGERVACDGVEVRDRPGGPVLRRGEGRAVACAVSINIWKFAEL